MLVDPRTLKPGSICHKALPNALLEQIGNIHKVVGPVLDSNLEEFERDFMRDQTPEREVAVWASIALAYLKYVQLHPKITKRKASMVLGHLIVFSTGVTYEESQSKNSKEEWDELLDCYFHPREMK